MAVAIGVATLIFTGGLVSVGAVSVDVGDALFEGENEPNVVMVPHDGPGGQYVTETEAGSLEVNFTNPGLNRNTELQFHRVFDLVNEDEEAVVVWVTHENGDVLRLYDDATGQTIAGESNAVSIGPGERVVVSIDVDSRGVTADELVTPVTFFAEFDRPFFEVDIVDIDEEIVAGQTLDVEAEIENVGRVISEQEVRLLVDNETVETRTVELGAGESETVSFEYETGPGAGEISVAVETDDDRDERDVTVEPAMDAFFDVTIGEIPEEVDVGDLLVIPVTVENLGAAPESQSIGLEINGEVVDSQTVELGGPHASNASIELTWRPKEGDEGPADIVVRSEDDTTTGEINVNGIFRAQASASSTNVEVNSMVQFWASRSITPPDSTVSYQWNIDGETHTGESISVRMTEPSESGEPREVTLTMVDEETGNTYTDTILVDVIDRSPPSIRLSVDEAVELGDPLEFDATESTDDVEIDRFEWDFGDGTTGGGPNPEHTYDEPGRYVVTLSVFDTSGNEATARFEVVVRSPRGSLSTGAIEYGSVGIGSSSGESIVVNNTGTTPLEMDDVEITGSEAFELVGDASGGELTVEPGDSKTIEVSFVPTEEGDESATLTFESNNPDSMGPVQLSGTGLAGDLRPLDSRVEFGNVPVDETDGVRQRTITVENVGEGEVNLVGAELRGSNANVFEIVDGGDATLGPNETHDITVEFGPIEEGSRTANLRIVSDEGTATVSLYGYGEAPSLRLARESIGFPTTGLGKEEDTSVEIRNAGSQPLDIDDIDVSGPGSEHFRVETETVPSTVGPGETEAFDLVFEPQEDGDHEASLTIESNDPISETATIPVGGSGVGAEISINYGTLDFGGVPPGGDDVYMNITVRNKQNSPADLEITATDIVGGDEDSFYVNRGGAPITLAPGESRDIEIGYVPPDEGGNRNSQLLIESDARNEPVIDVWLSNSGAHIMVQEIGNPTINVEGRNLIERDRYDINTWRPRVDEAPAGIQRLEFTAGQQRDFETNVEHDTLRGDVTGIETSDLSTLQYIQLNHLEMEDPDRTFTGTGLRYQVRKSALSGGVGPDDVTLYRWNNDGEWVNLTDNAVLEEETDTHYVFVAETPGFSQFALTVPSEEEESPPGTGPGPGPRPGSGAAPPSEEGEEGLDEGERPEEEEAGPIRTNVEFEDDGNIPTFETREVSSEEILELDRATADEPPRAHIFPRGGRGQPLEADRTVTIGGQTTTLSAEHTRIMTAGEPAELTGERSMLSSGEAITERDRMVGAVEISVPENRRDRPATIQLRVDRDRFGDSDPHEATIGHRTDGGWELLSTDVIDETEDEVVLSAETPRFSIFGVFADPKVQYEWTLPDGTTAEGSVLNHTFAEPGLYEVELTVTDAFDRRSSATYQVLANDVPGATISIVDREEDEVTLAANVENEIGETDVTWTFADGTEMTGEEVTRTLEDGQHEIELHVIDEFGAESRLEETVAVGSALQTVADALGVDLEFLVQLSLLSALGGTLALGYRRLPWGMLASRARKGPEIKTLSSPAFDADSGRFSIERLVVEDAGELDEIIIEMLDEKGQAVVQKRIDASGTGSYTGAPETGTLPPGVEFAPETHTVRVEAANADGKRVERHATATAASETGR